MTEPLYRDSQYTQWVGDNEAILKELPESSVDMIMTSPPFFGLRSYKAPDKIFDGDDGCEHEWIENIRTGGGIIEGTRPSFNSSKGHQHFISNFCSKCGAWRGQLGSEPWPDLYIQHLCNTFDLCKRVLKKTGSLWVNLADSRSGSGKGMGSDHGKQSQLTDENFSKTDWKACGILPKSMIGIPERFMLQMISRGWILRNKIVWKKPNCLPSSANDRLTDDYEMLYMFTQSQKYFFEMQYEEYQGKDIEKAWNCAKPEKAVGTQDRGGNSQWERNGEMWERNQLGRHMRSVWEIPTKGIKGMTHHAVFPEALCTLPILAGCPEFICTKCGKPRIKIYQKTSHYTKREEAHAPNNEPSKVDSSGWERPDIELVGMSDCGCDHDGRTQTSYDEGMNANRLAKLRQNAREHGGEYQNPAEFVGLSSCECANSFRPGIVLDPFSGSGTVALEARRLGREAWVIDISETYAKEAVERVTAIPNPFE